MAEMLTVSDAAAKKAQALLQKIGKPEAALRIRVVSGGCSGLEYKIEPDVEAPKATDTVIESRGVKVYLDAKGLLYMAGSELDYSSSLMSSGFKIRNPQSAAECACGQSFTV